MTTAWYIFDLLCYLLIAVAPALFYLSPKSRRCFAATIRRPSRWMLVAAILVSAGGAYKLVELVDDNITLPHHGAGLRLGMALSVLASLCSIFAQRLRHWSAGRNQYHQSSGDVGNPSVASAGINSQNATSDLIATYWGNV